MKKLNRKLIPAFAMLLLSAVLMSTASFAWFSMNGDVKATGMSVSATAPAALWISTSANANFGTSITLEGKSGQITPVTYTLQENDKTNADSWAFDVLTEEGYAAVGANGQVTGTLADLVEADDGSNVLKQTFYLRLEGKNISETEYEKKAIKANIKVTSKNGSSDLIYQALHVAIVAADAPAVGGTNPNSTAYSVGGSVLYDIPNEAMTVKEGDTVASATMEGSTSFLTLAAQETIAVYVYIWFEGTDEACINDNSQSLDFYNVDLQFVAGAAA